MADEFYGQRDVMRMPEPEEFRRLRPRRATPIRTVTFWSQPGVPGSTFPPVTDAREYLFVPAPAEAATAQVSVPSLS